MRWEFDDEEDSFTGLAKAVQRDLGEDDPYMLMGYWFWTHPEFDYRNLSDLRNNQVTANHRKQQIQEPLLIRAVTMEIHQYLAVPQSHHQ